MNKETFDHHWKQIRSQTTIWWSLMSEYDLKKVDKAANKLEKYATMLQVKYGYQYKQAKEEITKRIAEIQPDQTASPGGSASK